MKERAVRACGGTVRRNWSVCLPALTALTVALASCGGGSGDSASIGGGPPPPVTYSAKSGVAQKGPLIRGSTVIAQELDSSLSPTGKQYTYQTTSDLGTFSPTSKFTSQYIGLTATGYYFDEVAGALSTGTVTLDAYSDLTASSVLNVNLLTTLAYQRIQHLVTESGMSFGAATSQAEHEVLTALNIPASGYGSFGTLDLGGGTDGDHMLAAVSSIFVYGNAAGPLSQLIANFQSDIGTNGVITSAATKAALTSASRNVNPVAVAASLAQAYSSVGGSFTAADISDWIDQDGDGVVGKFKFQLPDASPSSVFTLPAFVVGQVAGTSISVAGGRLSINGTPVSGASEVHTGDVVAISPGASTFPNGILSVYLLSGTTKIARVSFVSTLLSITVTPATPSVAQGLTQQFTAKGTFSDTSTADLTSLVSWTSNTPAVATVSATGLATSLTTGSAVITATSGSVSGSATFSVTPAVLESISITPNPALAGIGFPRPLTATATYSDATTADVTSVARWSTATQGIATVGPTTGLVTGVSLGSTTVSAAIGSISATVPLNIGAGVWYPSGSLVTPRNAHTATLLKNGKVLVTGGIDLNGQLTAASELYDPAAGTWTPTGSLATARYWQTATLLPDGKVLVAGGGTMGGPITASELYDPAAGTWTSTGSLATARVVHTATLLANGKVLVTGGTSDGTNVVAGCELYDPAAGTWTSTGSLATARIYHTATLLQNGKVLVTGGSSTGIDVVAASELYDPAAGTWTTTGSLAFARDAHTATLLANGKVLVAGGGNNNGIVTVATSELYDPAAGKWTSTGSLATARFYHTATLLPSGKVLVTGGGFDRYSALATSELYDPAAGTWAPTGSLTNARFQHTATLLPNGAALVAGGEPGISVIDPGLTELYW